MGHSRKSRGCPRISVEWDHIHRKEGTLWAIPGLEKNLKCCDVWWQSYMYWDLPIAASQKSLCTSYYRNLLIIHPWAMNISGYSKRGVGIFLRFTALGSRLTALKSKTQSLHVQNSAMSHTATVILALLLPGEQEQSLRVSSCRNNKRDRARHSRSG